MLVENSFLLNDLLFVTQTTAKEAGLKEFCTESRTFFTIFGIGIIPHGCAQRGHVSFRQWLHSTRQLTHTFETQHMSQTGAHLRQTLAPHALQNQNMFCCHTLFAAAT